MSREEEEQRMAQAQTAADGEGYAARRDTGDTTEAGTMNRRPQPGEQVIVDGLNGTFVVEAYEGAVYRLQSKHGTILRAGVRKVRFPPRRKAA